MRARPRLRSSLSLSLASRAQTSILREVDAVEALLPPWDDLTPLAQGGGTVGDDDLLSVSTPDLDEQSIGRDNDDALGTPPGAPPRPAALQIVTTRAAAADAVAPAPRHAAPELSGELSALKAGFNPAATRADEAGVAVEVGWAHKEKYAAKGRSRMSGYFALRPQIGN